MQRGIVATSAARGARQRMASQMRTAKGRRVFSAASVHRIMFSSRSCCTEPNPSLPRQATPRRAMPSHAKWLIARLRWPLDAGALDTGPRLGARRYGSGRFGSGGAKMPARSPRCDSGPRQRRSAMGGGRQYAADRRPYSVRARSILYDGSRSSQIKLHSHDPPLLSRLTKCPYHVRVGGLVGHLFAPFRPLQHVRLSHSV